MKKRYAANFAGHEISFDLDRNVESENRIADHFDKGQPCEPEVVQAFFRFLQPGDLVVDVGANCGYFTAIAAALVGPSGKVIAVEPAPDMFDSLLQNMDINGFDNVEIITKPLADKQREVRFALAKEGPSFNCIWDSELPVEPFAHEVLTLPTTTLDKIIPDDRTPKLVKIDVEGAEHLILKGAYERLFRHHIPFVIAELSDENLLRARSSQSDLRRYLYGLGYDTFVPYANGAFPKWIPPTVLLKGATVLNLLYAQRDDVSLFWNVEHHESYWVPR